MNRNFAPINDPKLVLEVLAIQTKMANVGWQKAYEAYRKSGHWTELKRRMSQERPQQCEICGCTENVDLYHLQYKNLLRAKLSDLIWLCDVHHDEIPPQSECGKSLEVGESHFLLRDTMHHLFDLEQKKADSELDEVKRINHKLVEELNKADLIIADLTQASERSLSLEEELQRERSVKQQLSVDNEQLNLRVKALTEDVADAQRHSQDFHEKFSLQRREKEVLLESIQESNHEQERLLERVHQANKKQNVLLERLQNSNEKQQSLLSRLQQSNEKQQALSARVAELQWETDVYQKANIKLKATVDEQKQQVRDLAAAVNQQELLLAEVRNSTGEVNHHDKDLKTLLNIKPSRWAGSLLLVLGLVAGFVSGQTLDEMTRPTYGGASDLSQH